MCETPEEVLGDIRQRKTVKDFKLFRQAKFSKLNNETKPDHDGKLQESMKKLEEIKLSSQTLSRGKQTPKEAQTPQELEDKQESQHKFIIPISKVDDQIESIPLKDDVTIIGAEDTPETNDVNEEKAVIENELKMQEEAP